MRAVALATRAIDPQVVIKERVCYPFNPPRAVSLGVHCLQGVLCVPQANGTLNQECGLGYRLCRKMPEVDKKELRKFRGFVRFALAVLFPQRISPDYDFSVPLWLSKTHYPLWRQMDLLRVLPDIPLILTWKFFKSYGMCKAFIKLENYTGGTIYEWGTYKPPRIISSRTDHVKVAVGPIIKAIEESVYKLRYFVKHVPIPDRPSYLQSNVYSSGCRYMSSDFTSFECGFTPAFMACCEFALYKYMLKDCPVQLQSIKAFQEQCVSVNRVHCKNVSCYMQCRRQSGEMTTSLGNGFTNLMLTAFMLRDVVDIRHLKCVVEGDDGLFAIPYEWRDLVSPDRYAKLGFIIKSEWSDQLSEASFCGLIYDEEDRINITNPIDEILSIGWSMGQNVYSNDKRLKDLLVAKTYSLAYEYSGCPIIYKLARWLSRVNGLKFNFQLLQSSSWSNWEREKMSMMLNDKRSLDQMLAREPSIRSRLLMERVFGVSVSDQMAFERYFDSLDKLCPIDIPAIAAYVCPMAVDNLKRVVTCPIGTSWASINDLIAS